MHRSFSGFLWNRLPPPEQLRPITTWGALWCLRAGLPIVRGLNPGQGSHVDRYFCSIRTPSGRKVVDNIWRLVQCCILSKVD